MIKIVIFDFDGVLADSFDTLYLFNKKSLACIGINLTKKQYKDFFKKNYHLGIRGYVKNEADYKIYSKFRKKNFPVFYTKTKLFPGTKSFLKRIENKYKFAIASATQKKFILELLEKNKIRKMFDSVMGTKEYTKEGILKIIKKRFKTTPDDIVMISDTTGDIKIAKKLGFKTIGVTWGFHSSDRLKKVKPNYLARNFKELILNLKKFQ